MIRLKILFIAISTLITSQVFSQQGYEIEVKIPSLKDSTIILAHYNGKEGSFFPDDTVKLNSKGIGVFEGWKPLTGGMYIIYLPTKHYFDFFMGDQQRFKIEADTVDLVKGIKFQGSNDNELFYEYRKIMNSRNEIASKKSNSSSGTKRDSLTKALDDINREMLTFINRVYKDKSKLYFSTWLKSLQEIEVPDYPRNAEGNVTDSAFRYNFWHKHYFDNFPIADSRLLRTPFYEEKVKYYLEKVIPQHPDSINNEIDWVMSKAKGNDEIFRYLLGMLYNHYASLANQIVGMDGVFVYFAEKYYLPYATWIDDKFKESLQKTIARVKPNLIGNVAPDIALVEVPTDHFLVAQKDTAVKSSMQFGNILNIKNIKAKYLIVIFWEYDCGHCKKEIPLLYDSIYPRLKDKGVKILAIHTISGIDDKRKWVDFVNDHKMYDFINAVPYSNDYRDLYNVYSTPTIYLLDENKKIIFKRIGVEQIEGILNNETDKKLHALMG